METAITEKLALFFAHYQKYTYKKGDILLHAGDTLTSIFYLTKGLVKQYAISKKGDELVVNVFKPISFFPMASAINESQNNYFFEAMTEIELHKAPKDDVVTFIKANPDVLYDLISRVYKGTDGLLTRMVYLMAGKAYTRLITELLIYGKRFGEGTTNIEIHLSERDLATYSGMARETVSREMKVLKDKGLILMHKNLIIIRDLGDLELELLEGE